MYRNALVLMFAAAPMMAQQTPPAARTGCAAAARDDADARGEAHVRRRLRSRRGQGRAGRRAGSAERGGVQKAAPRR